MVYLTNINLSRNELQNAVIQPLATAPANPKLGQIYTDSSDYKIKWYNGTVWKTIGVVVEASSDNGKIVVDGTEMTVYELPIATASVLGGMKIGSGLKSTGSGGVGVDTVDNLTSTDATKALSAAQGKNLKDSMDKIIEQIGELGGGDMMKAVYDTDNNGIVDNSEKLGGQLPSYYAKATDLDGKVDKVTGMGLSTNDYTTAEKNKLAGIAEGAEVNVNADWNATSGDAQILNKPTALSAFTNDEGFVDSSVSNLANYYKKSETYTQTEVNTLIGNLATIQVQVVEALPTTGKSNIIYLVKKSTSGAQNAYTEYLWTGSAFEVIGDTEIDLSNYLTKTGDASSTTVAFSAASARANIASGETEAVLMGKIAKYFADLKTVAFTGAYSDLSGTPSTIKTATFSVTGTSGSKTVSGTAIAAVTIVDSVTKEVVLCDVSISGLTATVNVATAPTNALTATVVYY